MSESQEGSPTPVVQTETKTTGLKITRVGEFVPKNPRTEKLLEARRNEEKGKCQEAKSVCLFKLQYFLFSLESRIWSKLLVRIHMEQQEDQEEQQEQEKKEQGFHPGNH